MLTEVRVYLHTFDNHMRLSLDPIIIARDENIPVPRVKDYVGYQHWELRVVRVVFIYLKDLTVVEVSVVPLDLASEYEIRRV